MVKETKINVNLAPLNGYRKKLAEGWKAKVGIWGSKAQRDDKVNNVELGIIHEFGSENKNIPPRSFLRMPLETKRGELMTVFKKNHIRGLFEQGFIYEIMEQLGIKALSIIDQAFDSRGFGRWIPNKPSTIAKKGSDKPLIDTQKMRQSIVNDVVKGVK
jgi:hypothetical protein